jgi:hypothetical protein
MMPLALALLVFCSTAARPGERPGHELARRLAASGRAVARFERVAGDPLTGRDVRLEGRLALEPPDRVLLEFGSTGERLALRGEGGEWLQPALEQLLVLGPERARAARVWWSVLAGEEARGISIRRERGRRFAVSATGHGETDGRAWLTLDGRGLPALLELDQDGARTRYRFSGWRFTAPRGRRAFVIEAPPGFEVVRLP